MVVDVVAVMVSLVLSLFAVDFGVVMARQIGEGSRCVTPKRLDARDFRVIRMKVVVLLMMTMIFGRLQTATVCLSATTARAWCGRCRWDYAAKHCGRQKGETDTEKKEEREEKKETH